MNPGIPSEGIGRREYRIAKFGSWEYSRRLDARVAENGRQAGIEFRHDLMERTPNSFRGHVLLAFALRQGLEAQNRVAERLFSGYFTKGEDVGDVQTLLAIARDCGIDAIRTASDFDHAETTEHVRDEERQARDSGIQGVPHISFEGRLVSEGAAPEEILAATLRKLAVNSSAVG